MSARSTFAKHQALSLLIGLIGAVVCLWANTPLPWMIGPLVATAIAGMSGLPMVAAPALRNAGQWAIGTALGLYFTPQVIALVASQWAVILIGIVWALCLGAAFGGWLAVTNRGLPGLDRSTTFFASAIGGASEMTVLAERHGGRVELVVSAHSLRIVLVVVLIPFALQWAGLHGLDPSTPGPQEVRPLGLLVLCGACLGGAMLMQRFDLTNPWVLGPLAVALLLTANGIELSALPRWITNSGQLLIGVALGTRFTRNFLRTAPRWLGTVAIGTIAMIVLSAAYAWLVADFADLHPATVMVGTSPGGIAEMCLTAKALQLGVPVVTAFHVTRMVAVVLLAGPLFRLMPAARRTP
ncbi:AbrB family transcriptional regulator [Piscinibacter sakaiensis]|uniref:AbrB family transcriptional regulator n=1 Tax=Piscinibacter sakaiensis TaxID=1547922 RepID=UPI003AAE9296